VRLALPIALIALIGATPLAAPWLQVVLTIALAKGFAVLGIVVLLRAGQVSFGHAMFFAASAYAAAFLTRALDGADLAVLLLAGVACAAAFGVVVGAFVVGYRYIFFGMLNLAFSMVLYSILEKFFYITGGSDGMRLERPTFFGAALDRAHFEIAMFYLVLALAIAAGWLVHRYFASPPGQALIAIKTNETRLEYLGVSARTMLLIGYVISAVLAGLGGTILAMLQGVVTPEFGYWVRSGEFVFIAILGGIGHVIGAFAGAIAYELVRTYAAAFAADVWQLTLGVFLLLIILFASRGLVGLYQDVMVRVFGRSHDSQPLAASKAEE
jgi:ABC-type branched-subunit amino acid transport system permease subunit